MAFDDGPLAICEYVDRMRDGFIRQVREVVHECSYEVASR